MVDAGITSVGYGVVAYGVGSVIGIHGLEILSASVPRYFIALINLAMEIVSILILWRDDEVLEL